MEQLKPCPFCGGKAIVNAYGFDQYTVECKICWVETSRKIGIKKAIESWNRRVADGKEVSSSSNHRDDL